MFGIGGGLMRCRACRYIYGINEMQAVKAFWGTFFFWGGGGWGRIREELFNKRDVNIAVELTGRPTIQVVSQL